MVLFVLHDPSDGLDEGIGGFHQSFCSASGRSNTMVMSISPRLSWVVFQPASAPGLRLLCSHRFRSHSSIARCASDPVCGGDSDRWVPSAERNALSDNVAAGTAARP